MKVESSFWPETSSLFELSVSAPSQMSCRVWLEHFFQPSAAFLFSFFKLRARRKRVVSS